MLRLFSANVPTVVSSRFSGRERLQVVCPSYTDVEAFSMY